MEQAIPLEGFRSRTAVFRKHPPRKRVFVDFPIFCFYHPLKREIFLLPQR
jgi:hypothetical protein